MTTVAELTTGFQRTRAVDQLIKSINGVQQVNPDRFGYLTKSDAAATLDAFAEARAVPMKKIRDGQFEPLEASYAEALAKDVSIATGLVYYDLRAPAMNLFPTVTPLRNAIGRTQRPNPGDAAHWKAIYSTTGSGFPYMGWVPEGRRSASMSYSATTITQPYATMGEEDSLTDEARLAAQGFEDESALVQLRLLLKMFVKEEAGILGGNSSLTLGAPGTITSAAAGSGATLPTLNPYSIYCVALTMEGFLNSSLANGVATGITVTGNDGKNFTLNGGSSALSAQKTQAVTLGQILSVSVANVPGAVGYAWYVGAAGSETLQAITTISSATFSAPLTAGAQGVSAITGDHSNNGTSAFNGLLTTAYLAAGAGGGSAPYFNGSPNSYVVHQANGTAGTGTGLTASGHGGVVEIDNMLVSMWNNSRVSPTVIYVNAQELANITSKVLTNASAPLLRYNVEADAQGMVEYKLTAAGTVAFYFNPYTADGGVRIPIKIHPNLAPGTIIGWTETLPPWYVSNETPTVAQMLTRQDYTNEVWPRTERQQYYGVYVQEQLAVYAPFAMGVIDNIGNA